MHAQEGSDFKTVLDFHAAEVISMVARQVDLNRDPAIRVPFHLMRDFRGPG